MIKSTGGNELLVAEFLVSIFKFSGVKEYITKSTVVVESFCRNLKNSI